MTELNKKSRIAGLFYFILVVTGIINLMYVPTRLIVWDNAAQTLDNIIQQEWLFRVGIASGVVAFLVFLVLPLALYRLLHTIDKTHATLMVILALASIPLSFANMIHRFNVLTLIGKAEYLNGLDLQAMQIQVMLQLEYFSNGIKLSQIFWGLWLFPFGYLVYKSGFLPKAFGILLMMGCFGYLIQFFGGLLITGYRETIFSTIAGIPASVGEIGICLWLLLVGAREKKMAL